MGYCRQVLSRLDREIDRIVPGPSRKGLGPFSDDHIYFHLQRQGEVKGPALKW